MAAKALQEEYLTAWDQRQKCPSLSGGQLGHCNMGVTNNAPLKDLSDRAGI